MNRIDAANARAAQAGLRTYSPPPPVLTPFTDAQRAAHLACLATPAAPAIPVGAPRGPRPGPRRPFRVRLWLRGTDLRRRS